MVVLCVTRETLVRMDVHGCTVCDQGDSGQDVHGCTVCDQGDSGQYVHGCTVCDQGDSGQDVHNILCDQGLELRLSRMVPLNIPFLACLPLAPLSLPYFLDYKPHFNHS